MGPIFTTRERAQRCRLLGPATLTTTTRRNTETTPESQGIQSIRCSSLMGELKTRPLMCHPATPMMRAQQPGTQLPLDSDTFLGKIETSHRQIRVTHQAPPVKCDK